MQDGEGGADPSTRDPTPSSKASLLNPILPLSLRPVLTFPWWACKSSLKACWSGGATAGGQLMSRSLNSRPIALSASDWNRVGVAWGSKKVHAALAPN